MKYYWIFGLLLFSIQGCVFSNCKQKDLPDSEKEWFKGYKIGQQSIFKSNLDRTDTLTVTELMDDYTPCNKFELGDYQFNIMKVRFISTVLSRKNQDYIYLEISIEESGRVVRLFDFIDLSKTFYDLNTEVERHQIYVPKYNDSILAFNFNEGNCRSSWGKTIKSFSWSKKHGIVQYETKEGERFELIR